MNELSLELFRLLYLCRRSEQAIMQRYGENEMRCPMHMSMGQEAIPVGVCEALGPDAQILASYRSHAAYLAKTRDTDGFFAEIYGKAGGTASGKGGSMHLMNPQKGFLGSSGIVGSCIPVAVGATFASRELGKNATVAVFFGDGALEEGVFWESMNVACLMKLPVLFVCEDNGLAVHTRLEKRRGFTSIAQVLAGFDCVVATSDSTDAEAIYKLAKDSVSQMRRLCCPAFLNLKCYRYLEHVGIGEDFDEGYRSRAEYEVWKTRDSLAVQRNHLERLGYAVQDIEREEKAIDEMIEGSIRKARAGAFAGREQLYRGVFHEGN
jgi:acetoin:2,6-dichlorophenolindophenol oxidoreductase subunit alpha